MSTAAIRAEVERAGGPPVRRWARSTLPSVATLVVVLLFGCGDHVQPSGDHENSGHRERAQQHPVVDETRGHSTMVHRFEDADEWAKRFDDPERDAWQKPGEVVRLMRIESGMRIADVGAGTGYFLPRLSRAVGEHGSVVGLDIEKDMVRYMLERAQREGLANVQARMVAPDDPELAAGSMDRILIVDTWHHIRDRSSYSKKLAAGLSDAGEIVIVDFTMESERGPPKAHRISAATILSELEAAGLSARLVEEALPDQFIVIASRR